MGLLARLQATIAVIVSISMVAIIYAKLQDPLISKAKSGGKWAGFMSKRVKDVDQLLPVVLALLLLGIVVWFVVSTVQSEKTKQVRQPPR